MEKDELLLKEYEFRQQDNQTQLSRYWTILGLFISINIHLIGGLWILSNTDFVSAVTDASGLMFKIPILFVILIGVFLITKYMELSLRRSRFVIETNIQRICDIEIELGLWKQLPLFIADQWLRVRKKLKYKENLSNHETEFVWKQVWEELPNELQKVNMLGEKKEEIQQIALRKHQLYFHSMEQKAPYMFWGIFTLWIVTLGYIMVLSAFNYIHNWSLMLYIPIIFGAAWDYYDIWKKEHQS